MISPLTGIALDSYFGKVKNIYEADNGDVYIYEPVYYLSTDSWIKATKGEGDTLVVNLPQVIDSIYYEAGELGFNSPDSTIYYYVDRLVPTQVTEGYTYAPSQNHSIKFTYKDGDLKQVPNADGTCDLLGVVDPTGTWAGCGDFFIERNTQRDVATTIPADAEPVDYKMSACKDDDYPDETTVTLYHKGNDVYMKLDNDYISGCAKGTIKDNRLVFEPQYVGKSDDGRNYLYFMPATVTQELDDDWGMVTNNYNLKSDKKLEFEISNDGNTFSADSGYVVNCGWEKYDSEYEYPRLVNITLDKVVETPATPAAPEIIYAPTWNDAKNEGSFTFYDSAEGENYEYLNPNKLFYEVYINDKEKPFTFTAAQYPSDFTENVTDVPFTHSSPKLFASGNTRDIKFYDHDWKAIGVQMIYRGAGEERRSEIVWTYNTTAGIKGIIEVKKDAKMYDLQGRRIHGNLAKGLYIKDGKKYLVK
jgi:hypothetical protein